MSVQSWPKLEQYERALLVGAGVLKNPALQAATVERYKDHRKLVGRRGGAGAVYRLTSDSGEAWALKLFTRSLEHSAERFVEISTFLEREGHEPYFVSFRYESESIFVVEHWFPALVMAWCPGLQLDLYIDRQVEAGTPIDNRALAVEWLRLRADLRRKGVMHGDLQHGNVLVSSDGRFRLVDYDGVVVPRMTMNGVFRTERGHPDYQHMTRMSMGSEPTLSQFRSFEDFSSLVILASLAIVDGPLWREFGGRGQLLIHKKDLADPESSGALVTIADRSAMGASLIALIKEAIANVEQSDELLGAAAELFGQGLPPWREDDRLASARGGRSPKPKMTAPGGTATADPRLARSAASESPVDLSLLVDGLEKGRGDAAIARELGTTTARVRATVLRLQRELGVASRRELPAAHRRQVAGQPQLPEPERREPAAGSATTTSGPASVLAETGPEPPIPQAGSRPGKKKVAPAKRAEKTVAPAKRAEKKVAPAKRAEKTVAPAKRAEKTDAPGPSPAKPAAPSVEPPTTQARRLSASEITTMAVIAATVIAILAAFFAR